MESGRINLGESGKIQRHVSLKGMTWKSDSDEEKGVNEDNDTHQTAQTPTLPSHLADCNNTYTSYQVRTFHSINNIL